MLVLLAGLVVAGGIAVGIDSLVSAGISPTSPQRILDSLVSGTDRVAPGASAYVFGPHGTWSDRRGSRTSAPGRGCRLTRACGWQPLVAPPGTQYHHSNIGWNIVGLIAARAAGEPLPAVYQQRLFAPLGLTRTAYDPQGPIAGSHAEGYIIASNGGLTKATGWTYGSGADGAIVTDAAEEAAFLNATIDNKLGIRREFLDFWPSAGVPGRFPGNVLIAAMGPATHVHAPG